MECFSCNYTNPEGHKFCGQCGEQLSISCQACRFVNKPDHKFCGGCGKSLITSPPKKQSSEAERRQLTVMFCDLVGSTAMSELMDPEDLRDVISSYQDICQKHINRYGGYIARYMGDGLLVYFGYPTANERDPERSVRAGLDIIAEVGTNSLPDGTPLFVRVGIATGRVVVGDLIGEGASEERAVLGDTPNLAARLQGLAEPGSVCVSEATYALLLNALSFEALGPQSLKGITEKVLAYRALGEINIETQPVLSIHTPLVGRHTQIDYLNEQWRRTSIGYGRIVTIIGDPGFGKSRLVSAFREEIKTTNHQVLEIKASEFHQDSSFRPIRQMLRQTLNRLNSEFPNAPFRVLNNWLGKYTALNDDAPQILQHLLGIPIENRSAHNLDGAALKIHTVDTLVDLFVALSVEVPLLTIIEDAQWLDASTVEFMNRLVSQVSSSSILVLIAARPGFSPNWNKSLDINKLNIERLSLEQANELVTIISKHKHLPQDIRETLLERADGIPLYIEELTRSVIEASQSPQEDNNESAMSVPPTLQDSLMARLDRLGATKLIAQKAAVIGRVLDRTLLQAISENDHINVEQGILELLSCDMLVPRPDIREGLFEFRHALISDIAYQSLLIRRRKEIHAQVATALLKLNPSINETEPEVVAYHYMNAGIPDEALGFWKLAGDKATAVWANTEAIGHYKKAIAALTESAPDDVEQEVDLLLDMVECMRIVDRSEEAFTALDRAETLAKANSLGPQLINTYYQRGNLSFVTGDLLECVRLHTSVRDLARKSGAVIEEARAESGLGDASFLAGHIQTAEWHFDNCIEIARREDLAQIETSNLSLRGHMRLYLNQFSAATSDSREAVKLAVVAGNRRDEMVARGSCLAKILYELGQWEECDEQLIRASDIAKSLGARRFIPLYLSFRAKVAIAIGDSKAALELASSAVNLSREGELLFATPMALSTLARAVTDASQADNYLAEAEAILAQGSMSHNHFWFRLDAMELGLKRADAQMVARHAMSLDQYISAEPPAWAQFHIRRCQLLSTVPNGDEKGKLRSDILELIEDAKKRNQRPAIASLNAALEAI
jgi:predicted ATPase/class 3 adenylate cyclase